MSVLGNMIKKLRDDRELTQAQLGEKIGVAESTISLYEAGKREPDIATLNRFATFFNVSVDYLLGRVIDDAAEISAESIELARKINSLPNKDRKEIESFVQYKQYLNKDDDEKVAALGK